MKPGDHIRTFANGRFDHAIDCGDLTVIHLVSLAGGGGRAEVRRSRLSDFTAGAARVEVVGYPAPGYPPRMVVARAFSRLGATGAAAMFPTPEHFATWCVNGQLPPAPGPRAVVRPAASPAPKPARPGRGGTRPKPAKKRSVRAKASRRAPARRKAPARARKTRQAGKGRTSSRRASRKGGRRRR